MKKVIFIFLGILTFYTSEAWAQAKDNDFQVWTELKYVHPFEGSRFEIQWSTENRFRNDGDDYFLFNTTLGFNFKPYKWLTASFFYRFETVQGKDVFDDYKNENRLIPQVEFILPWGPLELKNRHRFEQRFFADEYRFRYRNRIALELPLRRKSVVSFTPYVSDEIFVETTKGFNQNRLTVGNVFGFLNRRFTFDLFYRLQKVGSFSGGWQTANILGTSAGVKY